MVSINRVQTGLSRYLDNEIMPKLSGWQKWVFSAAATAYIADASKVAEKVRSSATLAPLSLIDEANNIDVDKIYQHLRPAAEKCPAPISIPGMGTITLTVSDVDMLYNCIMNC